MLTSIAIWMGLAGVALMTLGLAVAHRETGRWPRLLRFVAGAMAVSATLLASSFVFAGV